MKSNPLLQIEANKIGQLQLMVIIICLRALSPEPDKSKYRKRINGRQESSEFGVTLCF